MGVMIQDIRHTPRQVEARVWQLFESGKQRQAMAACESLNREFPGYAPGWRTASQLLQRLNKRGAALRAIERALALEPDNDEWKLQNSYCLMQLGRVQAARPLLAELADRRQATPYQSATLALLLSRLGRHAEAAEHYRHAIAEEPGESQHYYNLATVQRFLGELDAADASLELALACNPRDYEAHKLRADLRRQTAETNHVEALEHLLTEGIDDPRGRAEVLYALAKEREDLEDYDASFTALRNASGLRRQMMRYAVEGDIATMQAIARRFSPEWRDSTVSGTNLAQPIFILGMPRTGSTLVEHVLANHSRVDSAGELNNFAIEMVRLARAQQGTGESVDKLTLVELSAGLDFAALGQAYMDSLPDQAVPVLHLIDKMPLNFLYVGLIHKALPGAKIIHVQRNPLDTCYAVYKTSFRDAYPFSYDLEELGRYYLAYRQLMDHWESLLGDALHTVRYELLVDNIEEEVGKLLAYCGLEFEPACLVPHENPLASTTASASQVRSPVYRSSVGKWRHYREQLAPLVAMLAEAGIDAEH
jgi:tetratricopeptide (TPR) repeat protein